MHGSNDLGTRSGSRVRVRVWVHGYNGLGLGLVLGLGCAIYIQFEKIVPKVMADWIKEGRLNSLDYPLNEPLSPMKFRKTIWWSWCGVKLQQYQGDRYCCLICHHKTAMQYDSVMMTDRNYVHLFEKGKISICDGCYQYAHAVYGAISYKVNRHGPTGLFILHREEGAW